MHKHGFGDAEQEAATVKCGISEADLISPGIIPQVSRPLDAPHAVKLSVAAPQPPKYLLTTVFPA